MPILCQSVKNHGFIKNRYIDFMIGICYNASRQKSNCTFMAKNEAPDCSASTFRGFFLFFLVVKRPPGYLLSLSCLSNHLQMRWQVTPAATVTKKVIATFMEFTSPRCRVSVGQRSQYNTT